MIFKKSKRSMTLSLIAVLAINYLLFGMNFLNYLVNPENSVGLVTIKNAKIIEVGDYQPQITVWADYGIKRLSFPGHVWHRQIRFPDISGKDLSDMVGENCEFELKKVNFIFGVDYSVRSIDCERLKWDRFFFEEKIKENRLSSFLFALQSLFCFVMATGAGFAGIYFSAREKEDSV